MAAALKAGKEVIVHGKIQYPENSDRPSKIEVEYIIDGEKKTIIMDNDINSTELMDKLKGEISEEDFKSFQEEINDMKEDKHEVSVKSIETTYDKDNNVKSVVAWYRDETVKENYPRKFQFD